MPFGSVKLIPGLNVERTPTLNEAGYSSTSLIRFKDVLAQKLGGWTKFYPLVLSGIPRDLHAWQDLNSESWLSVGTTTQLGVIFNGSLSIITPQQMVSDFAPNFTTTLGSPTIEIVDPNISNLTTYDSVFFNTPVSVGGLILAGLYPIAQITGTNSYQITASSNATAPVSHGGAVPVFTTASGSSIVKVSLNDNGLSIGSVAVFALATSGNGVTVSGSYQATTIINSNEFNITASTQASGTGSFSMNGGNAEILYNIALGPPPHGVGYGLGGYGLGGYGTGIVNPVQTGVPITAIDWTSDNWGEILITSPSGGGVYYWGPNSGFANAQIVTEAPAFCGGIFVSMAQQILVAWGASLDESENGGFGVQRDPLLVAWSDVGNFFEWRALQSTQAGNYRIPLGSEIRGGMAVSTQNLIWTDLDLWAMNYVGYPNVFGFTKIGSGAGLAGSHAAQQLRGNVYWMGQSNFYRYAGGGVEVIPCPVWDAVFQNLNTAFITNVRAMPNTPFNEVGWLYPSLASANGECDSYVKFNITEPGAPWDYGSIPRSAWIDQSVIGPPIGASPSGVVFQHEVTNDADGQPLVASFTTGYFEIAEGEDFPFIDQIIPDFKWGTYAGAQTAQIQISLNVVNYPGDTPVVYGPYTVSQGNEYISTRIRGRQMSVTVQSSDLGSFWRLGRIRYRWAPDGRR